MWPRATRKLQKFVESVPSLNKILNLSTDLFGLRLKTMKWAKLVKQSCLNPILSSFITIALSKEFRQVCFRYFAHFFFLRLHMFSAENSLLFYSSSQYTFLIATAANIKLTTDSDKNDKFDPVLPGQKVSALTIIFMVLLIHRYTILLISHS